MKISNLIFISIFFILLLFSITTYINFNQSEKVRENATYFSVSSTFVRQINELQRNIFNMERSLRGFLLTGEDFLLQTYDSTRAVNKTIFQECASIAQQFEQKERLDHINELYDLWINEFTEPVKMKRLRVDSAMVSSSNFAKLYPNDSSAKNEERIYKNLQADFSMVRNAEYKNRENNREVLDLSEQQTKIISFSLTGLSIITGFVIAFLLARHISQRIFKMVKMANSIANGNYRAYVVDKDNDELSKLSYSLNYMADTLAENISMLQRKNQELDQFAHIVSHDLKAPLRGIDNLAGWIEEDYGPEIPERIKEYLALIKGRVSRLENLIQGILTYARVGKETQVNEQINVRELVLEILENLPIKKTMNIEVSTEMPVFYSNRILLMQVFTNLISNSVKYHDKEDGKVKIYSEEHNDHFKFSVEDNGPGIAAAYHDKIFIIFQTLQERDSFESNGVGLAIVKKILVDRKEKVWVTSAPGKGSVFSFTWAK
ncbi:MAG: ATP-binding protein [Ferruginibacter sp.]